MKNKLSKYFHYRLTFSTLLAVAGIVSTLQSCKKYLDAKPNQTLATPATIDDLEGILNNYNFINARYASAGEVASDNYYLNTSDFNGLTLARQRMFYTWQKDDDIGGDYSAPYSAIEYANIILDALPGITGGDVQSKNTVHGNALFLRASYHYALSQLFAKPYIKASVKPVRSTIAETYNSILTDFQKAIPMLPSNPEFKYQAGKPAAYGMLARVYLSMGDYVNAGLYADSALQIYSTLVDYNTVSATATIPFQQFNNEVIYDARAAQAQALALAKARVDTNLYASYAANDLRKVLYFKKTSTGVFFKPNYTGQNNGALFTGVATDELYLIKSECQVRNGDISGGLSTLNALLSTRFKSGTFISYNISDGAQLLSTILQERRKELMFRGLRWTDLRRLNQDSKYAVTLYRIVNGLTYQLQPQSLRYIFEIDQNAVNIGGLIQNP
jgi:hypothetical protein